MTEVETEWWLVRHAPTVNPENVVYGSLDLDIAMPSVKRFDSLSKMLPSDPIWIISHLSRTRKTLDGILAARGISNAEIVIEENFAEQNLGDWEGRPSGEVWADINKLGMRWPADIQPPGGEKFSAVATRVGEAATSLSQRYSGQKIVAVIHAGSIRGFLSTAMGDSPLAALSYSVENLSVTQCDYFSLDRWRIRFVNRLVE